MEQPRSSIPGSNADAYAAASAVLPGGVSSPVRAWGAVGGVPRFVVSGRGPYVRDVEGREYVDLVGQWGPALLGHAEPSVVAAVQAAAARGLGFGAPSTGETALAAEAIRRVSAVERLRFVSTGTEATMTALRLARGTTGRDLVLKFAGCYHGHVDSLLAAAGSGVATLGLPGSAGVSAAVAAETIVLPYGDEAAVSAAFDAHGDRIAAVITEAAPANMGVGAPPPGFNRFLRSVTERFGALLILDEVLTGFRVSPAGWWGLEGPGEGWAPDLFTFGKVIGGGLPLAALGGRAVVMDLLAPAGPVYQAGTLSGNPLATAAGLAMLSGADEAAYQRLDRAASILSAEVSSALSAAGVPHTVGRAGSLFSVFFGDELPRASGNSSATGGSGASSAENSSFRAPRNFDEARATDSARYRAFFHAMADAGVLLPPSGLEAWFVSAAHDDAALDRVLAALPAAAAS